MMRARIKRFIVELIIRNKALSTVEREEYRSCVAIGVACHYFHRWKQV